MIEGIYFEDLAELVLKEPIRASELSLQPIGRRLIEDYVNLTSDTASSHTNKEYNKKNGYKDIFVPGFSIPPLAEVLYKESYPYFVHVIRRFDIKILKPLYPQDRIQVIEDFIEFSIDPRLIVDNSSPVSCRRKIKNQYGKVVAHLNIDYLIKRRI